MGVAADYASAIGLEAIQERVTALAARLRDGLRRVPGVAVRDLGPKPCGIVTFEVEGRSPAEIKAALRARGVNVSVTIRSATRLDMEERALESMVRASVHYYNLESEVDRFCDLVAGVWGAA